MAEPKQRKPGRPKDPASKRSRGVQRSTKPRKAFHDEQAVFDALDHYCRSFPHKADESDVLRAALRQFLAAKGFWDGPLN